MTKKGWFCISDHTYVEPIDGGLYAIYVLNVQTFKKKLIYIGMAENLKRRLAKHEVKRVLYALIDYPEIIHIKCRIENNPQIRKQLENELINKLKPKANTL